MKNSILILTLIIISFSAYSQDTIHVKNAREFLEAIKSDVIIKLYPGKYIVTREKVKPTKYFYFENEYDGPELRITNTQNLTIIGSYDGNSKPEIIADSQYADVIYFEKCSNIKIENIKAGHGSKKGECIGGVLNFFNTENITIKDCDLYGSGVEGITTDSVKNLSCTETIIEDCSYSIMTMYKSENLSFENCVFTRNREFGLVNVSDSKEVSYENCEFSDNYTMGYGYSIFNVTNSDVSLKKCTIKNNNVEYFANDKSLLTLKKNDFENNNFRKGTYANETEEKSDE